MISYDDAEKALNYLKSTDLEAARLRAYSDALEDLKKNVVAMLVNGIAEKLSAADKLKRAEGHIDYHAHIEKLRKAKEEWFVMQNKRNSAATQIDMWRSVNSNQRKGNI
jgi:hypothetical protein